MKIALRSIAFLLCLCGRSWSQPLPSGAPSEPRPAAPAGPSVAEAASKADSLLNDSEVWISELEGTAKGGADGSGCPPNFSVRSYLQDKKNKRGEKEIGADIPDPDGKTKLDWQFYNVCQAVAAKSEAPCSEASEISRPDAGKGQENYTKGVASNGTSQFADYVSQKDKCVSSYWTMRAKVAYIARDPNFPGICRETAPSFPPMKSASSLDSICSAWRGASADLGALTAAIVSGVKTPLKTEYAREVAREMVSDPAWCAKTDQDDAKLGCQELNDYRAALARKDGKTCRGGLCRMLMGAGPIACESYALKVKKHVCASFYQGKLSSDRGQGIEERLKLAEAFITSAAGRVSSLKDAQAFTERLDRVYALRDRLNRAVMILGPLGKAKVRKPAKGEEKKPQ